MTAETKALLAYLAGWAMVATATYLALSHALERPEHAPSPQPGGRAFACPRCGAILLTRRPEAASKLADAADVIDHAGEAN